MTQLDSDISICVLLCSHNGEAYLSQQLDSVLSQSVKAAAIYIYDWDSSDGTRDIIRKLVSSNAVESEIKFVFKSYSPGPSISFLEAASEILTMEPNFQYIAFCDQDDVWDREKLKVLSEHIRGQEKSPDLVFSDVSLIDGRGEILKESYFHASASIYKPPLEINHPSLLLVNPYIGMSGLVSRRLLCKLSALDPQIVVMHDWAVALECYRRGYKSSFVDEPLVRYRQHGTNELGASLGYRIKQRFLKARKHFRKVDSQLKYVVSLPGSIGEFDDACSKATFSRFSIAWAGATSPFLRLYSRICLAGLILIFWPVRNT